MEKLFADVFKKGTPFLDQTERIIAKEYPQFYKASGASVFAFKENSYLDRVGQMLEEVPTMMAIFLVRDPIKVIESWGSAPREFPSNARIEDEWEWAPSKNVTSREFFGYRKWESSTTSFIELAGRFPDRTIIIRYEDLAKFPDRVSRRLFRFLGLDFHQQTQSFILGTSFRQHLDRPYSVFRSIKENQLGPYNLNESIVRQVLVLVKEAGLDGFTLGAFDKE